MSADIVKIEQRTEVKKSFQWRDRTGIFHYPSQMGTKHLFYTFLMIWNHSCPEYQRIWFTRAYTFPKFYTNEYMAEAICEMLKELAKRMDDLGPRMQEAIHQVFKYV